MLSRLASLCLAAAILTFSLPSAAQSPVPGGGTGATPGLGGVPDFGRLADPSLQTNIRFQSYDKTPLKFSTTTQYVLVPVVVMDKNGEHIPGLTKDAFHLQENGKDQKIASMEEIKPSVTPLSRPATASNEVTNQISEDAAPRHLVIIALDEVNTPFMDQPRARQGIITYLSESLDPDCLYLLVTIENNGLRVLHDYTQDTAGLIAALKALQGKFPTQHFADLAAVAAATSTEQGRTLMPKVEIGPTGTPDFDSLATYVNGRMENTYARQLAEAAATSTLVSFQQIAERVSGIPGRKSLIWVTGSFPFSIDPGSASISEGVSFAVYQHTMERLIDQQVSMYPVDAKGLLTLQPDASVHTSRLDNANPSATLQSASDRKIDTDNTMRAFADMTGGLAYINTNDTKGAIRDAVGDGEAYYMLSYPVDKSDTRAGWRKISVKVGDYKVRARKGYFLTQTTIDPTKGAKDDIDAALKSPFDYTGLPMRMVLDPPVAAGGKSKVTFAMMMPPKSTKIDSDSNNLLHVDIAYAVWSSTGQDAAHKGVSYNLNLNQAQLQQIDGKGLSYGDTVELAPGNYRLCVVVRNNFTGQIGSVSSPLLVK